LDDERDGVARQGAVWGTSEWSATEVRGDRHRRSITHKPVTEQSQYNLLDRHKVEEEFAELFAETGYGSTI
jgi:aryl-alcohol dehydrogenase-like predicted oxidoreductase